MRMLVVLALLVCSSAGGQVLKCNVNGAVLYQDRPCGGGAGEQVAVPPAAAPEVKSKASIDALRLNVKTMELDRSIREKEHQIARAEKDTNALQAQRDSELAQLQAKKSLAQNNLAGATWERSISAEMQVVTDTYRTRIQVLRDRIEGWRRDITDLRKQQSELK